MCASENSDDAGHLKIHNMERESPYDSASNREVRWKVRNGSPGVREVSDKFHSIVDCFKELFPESVPLPFVPECCLAHFFGGLYFEPET